jgi:hypothetical protein
MKKVRLIGVAIVALAIAVPFAKEPLKKHTPLAVIASAVYQDTLRRFKVRTGQIGDPYVAEHDVAEIPRFLEGVSNTYTTYLRYLDRQPGGAHVLEIGPGDNIGVALRFASGGARHVTIMDKFVPLQVSEFHRQLYARLRDGLPEPDQHRFDQAIDLSNGVHPKPERMTYLQRDIQEAEAHIPAGSVDLVVSNAVLQEVFDTDRMFAVIDQVLSPGGTQIHKIDLSDYGMFAKHGYHPLEFLTVPDAVYRYMVESTGQPNRRLVDYYRSKMQALGYDARIYATWILGVPRELTPPLELPGTGTLAPRDTAQQIQEIRPRLLDRYRQLSDDDLAVQGIMLVAKKPQ